MNTKPKISVVTPTWNRSKYLIRVYESLLIQTYQNFEWVVADDASEDDTVFLIMNLANNCPFPVVLIQASVHIGKARMDNEAIAAANGDFILWCDSDDYLLPNALENLINGWDDIPFDVRDNYIGVVGLCKTTSRILNKNALFSIPFDGLLDNLAVTNHMTEDAAPFLRSDILKKYPFPEVDLVIPESSVWSALGRWKARVLPCIVKEVDYSSENGISFSGKMKYNRGRAYSMALTTKYKKDNPLSFMQKLWRTINFFRYCIHGDIGFKEAFSLWGNNSSKLMAFASTFPAFILALKDRVQKKVEKTHLEFDIATKYVDFTISYYSASSNRQN